MSKKRLKLAEIRKNNCPFGLPIIFGCQYAGENIKKMAPLDIMGKDSTDDEKKMIGDTNTKLLAWNLLKNPEIPSKCPYAAHIMKNKDVVECNYEDTAPGEGAGQALQAAPFYSKIFNAGLTGLYTVPAGYYSDYDASRNAYYGIYSLQGKEKNDLVCMAKKIEKK